jgi:hypothetical protein
MSQYAPVVELSDLDGNNGFQIQGGSQFDLFGFSVASAGDVNGDGFDDIIIGARYSTSDAAGSGHSAYVVFGKASGFNASFSANDLDGTNGFKVEGVGAFFTGRDVASAGDVNGDGFDDFIVGSPYGHFGFPYGSAYVVFGTDAGFAASLDLTGLDGANGFRLDGEPEEDEESPYPFAFGWSVASGGDVNGDGFADLIVGAPYADPNGENTGASFVVFGKASGFGATIQVLDLDGNDGFRINGETGGAFTGFSVASAGDVNGDGFDDLIVGAPNHFPDVYESGATYVLFGMASGFAATLELSDIDGNNGFRIDGSPDGFRAGHSVASAGDVNADGIADLIVGSAANTTCTAYVVFGTDGGFAAELNLADLDGTDGFKITGTDSFTGEAVASAGDVNGDGFDDMLVGALATSPNGVNSGTTYVLFGKASGFAATVVVATSEDGDILNGNDGFQIYGREAGEEIGGSVASAGDMNGDGFADLIVSGAAADASATQSGVSYVVFGSVPGEAVTRTGTSIDNTIHGGAFDDTLNGLGGNDTLLGADGKDALNGAGGKDTLISDKGKDDLNGGAGRDILDGGKSDDRFIYAGASDSTGLQHDSIKKFDFAQDRFDTTASVAAIDAAVASGTLSKNSFDGDLAAAVGAGQLGAGNAVLFTPDAGNLAGKLFLVVDLNGTAGYQAGADLVVRLDGAKNTGSIDIGDFI